MEKTTTPELNLAKKTEPLHLTFPSYFRLLDITTFSYLGLLTLLILVFYERVQYPGLFILAHAGTVAILWSFFTFTERTNSKVVHFLREIYPLLLFTFFFKEVSLLLNMLFPFWFEHYLIAADKWLFGGYPTIMVERYFRPWLTEFMAFSYWSYYLILPLGGLLIFRRCSRKTFRSLAFNMSFTMYICYVCYFTFAARGPKHTLAYLHSSREIVGFFDQMVFQIQSAAGISGAAFPSSHVAAVWIVLIYLFNYRKWLGWLVTPLVVSLTLSTVYMQYHYAVDAIAGTLIVFLTYPLGRSLEKRFGDPADKAA